MKRNAPKAKVQALGTRVTAPQSLSGLQPPALPSFRAGDLLQVRFGSTLLFFDEHCSVIHNMLAPKSFVVFVRVSSSNPQLVLCLTSSGLGFVMWYRLEPVS